MIPNSQDINFCLFRTRTLYPTFYQHLINKVKSSNSSNNAGCISTFKKGYLNLVHSHVIFLRSKAGSGPFTIMLFLSLYFFWDKPL